MKRPGTTKVDIPWHSPTAAQDGRSSSLPDISARFLIQYRQPTREEPRRNVSRARTAATLADNIGDDPAADGHFDADVDKSEYGKQVQVLQPEDLPEVALRARALLRRRLTDEGKAFW